MHTISVVGMMLTDGSVVYDVELRDDHGTVTFNAVSKRDAEKLAEGVAALVSAHTVNGDPEIFHTQI